VTLGVEAVAAGSELARHTTLRNGLVSGFGSQCIDLGPGASVEGLVVRSCGGSGIRSGEHSIASGNRVSDCGAWGLSFLAAGSYGGNVLSNVNRLGGAGFVAGGATRGGNICDTEPCPRDGLARKRYYLTNAQFNGTHGGIGCATSFHMASIFELFHASDLEYDTTLGLTNVDSGSGPPSRTLAARGWVRTGLPTGFEACGFATSTWVTTNADGTLAWVDTGATTSGGTPVWNTVLEPCNQAHRLWCIED
jgi:hypothetical protein